MLKLVMGLIGISLLTGCFESGLVTDINQMEDYIEEEQMSVSEDISIYFERDQYALDKVDEVFFVVENNSDELIVIPESYFIQKHEEGEWEFIENHSLLRDTNVQIPAGKSTELLFWLPVDSIEFEKGQYRVFTRVNFPEQTEEIQEQYPDHEGVSEEVYLPFEIK